jgi:hypothetical protein
MQSSKIVSKILFIIWTSVFHHYKGKHRRFFRFLYHIRDNCGNLQRQYNIQTTLDSSARVLKRVMGFLSHSDHYAGCQVLQIIVLRLSAEVFHITQMALSVVSWMPGN